ncbi:unnamed protein product [Strongylus vulgaris]|uniref:Uncharacterized protein n=1 Tax=Strongylus vulgaris TaxID=40348 RepID=A0A3P7IE28_STRVU|nr:unnamed protein product [Strongylus vulgaris]
MITLLETEVNERFQHSKEETSHMLGEHTEKCNRKISKMNDSLTSLRNELARVLDLYGSLRQTVTKHTNEMETVRSIFKKSCDSVRQIDAELTAKLESLRRDGEAVRGGCDERCLQDSMCNLTALFVSF